MIDLVIAGGIAYGIANIFKLALPREPIQWEKPRRNDFRTGSERYRRTNKKKAKPIPLNPYK